MERYIENNQFKVPTSTTFESGERNLVLQMFDNHFYYCRTTEEFSKSHIDNALNVPFMFKTAEGKMKPFFGDNSSCDPNNARVDLDWFFYKKNKRILFQLFLKKHSRNNCSSNLGLGDGEFYSCGWKVLFHENCWHLITFLGLF